MAGPACKVIINNSVAAIMAGLEKILTSPLVRDCMMPSDECDYLIQALADLDIRTYNGTPAPKGRPQSLLEVLEILESKKVLTAEIWQVLSPRAT
jgi:hypothetical protein